MLIIPCLLSLRKKYPYSELFWSAFSRIRTQYGETRSISPYSVRMRENTDQNNSEYGYYLHSDREYPDFDVQVAKAATYTSTWVLSCNFAAYF